MGRRPILSPYFAWDSAEFRGHERTLLAAPEEANVLKDERMILMRRSFEASGMCDANKGEHFVRFPQAK